MNHKRDKDEIMKYIPYLKERFNDEPDPVMLSRMQRTLDGRFTFSLLYIVLGPIYYFYRKCYLEGIVITILGGVISATIPYGEYLMIFIGGAAFYPLYKRHLDILIKNNADPIKKGGTSMIAAVISIGVVIGLLVLNWYYFYR